MIFVEAIIFDLDGTLVDSRKDLTKSVQHMQALFGAKKSTEAQVASFIGDGVGKLVERSLPDVPARKLPEAVEFIKSYYREHCLERTHLYRGVKETLEHFKSKRLAVVTNKPYRISARILDGLAISPYFEVLIGGDSLPQKKPSPEPILSALKTMGLKPSKQIVMVGDGSPDILSGRAAGIRTCGIRSNIADHQILLKSRPDFTIKHMLELARLFS